MPATFPAHPAAVLPLKLWRPAWFDGLALTVGSMAPDLAYALDGSLLERPFPGLAPLWQLAHSLPWFLAWALPVTFALCLLLRLSAPAIAAHLPAIPSIATAAVVHSSTAAPAVSVPSAGAAAAYVPTAASAAVSVPSAGQAVASPSAVAPAAVVAAAGTSCGASAARAVPAFAFRRFISLRRSAANVVALLHGAVSLTRGPRWYVTASSAGIGALSHVLWDRIAVGPLDFASSLLGGLICFWLLHRLVRRRAGIRPPAVPVGGAIPGSRPAPAQPTSPSASASEQSPDVLDVLDVPDDGRGRRPILFWGTFAAVLVSGGVFLPSLPGYFLAHTMSARVILLAVGAVVIAAAVARLSVSRSRGKPLRR